MEIKGLEIYRFGKLLEREKKEIPEDSFSKVLKEFVYWVDAQKKNSKAIREAVLRGEDIPLHQMIIEFQKADVALNLLIEVRNRLLEGYQELMRMQV